MRAILFAPRFMRAYKGLIGKQPEMVLVVQEILEKLSQDPYQPSLGTHKLKGKMTGALACNAGYDLRVIFEFVQNKPEDDIMLINIGTHDEVY